MVAGKSWTEQKKTDQESKWKWEDNVEMFQPKDNKAFVVRPLGLTLPLSRHWIETTSGKKFPCWCPQFDSQTEDFNSKRPCPMHDDFNDRSRKQIYFNGISRELQEKGDDNPIRVFEMPTGLLTDLQNIIDIIKCDPADPEKGIDLIMKYNSKEATAAKRWSIQRGERTPLTAEEKKYTLYDWDEVGVPDFSKPEVAEEYAKMIKTSMSRHYWYVTKRKDGGFKPDENGKPYTEFPELVKADAAGINPKQYTEKIEKEGGGVTDDDDEVPVTRKAQPAVEDEDEAPVTKKTKPAVEDEDEAPVQKKVTKPSDDEEEAPVTKKVTKPSEDEEEAPAVTKKVTKPAEDEDEEESPVVKKAKPAEDEAPKKESKPAAKSESTKHPDATMKYKTYTHNGTTMEVPVCFTAFEGTRKCHNCPVKSKCVALTED